MRALRLAVGVVVLLAVADSVPASAARLRPVAVGANPMSLASVGTTIAWSLAIGEPPHAYGITVRVGDSTFMYGQHRGAQNPHDLGLMRSRDRLAAVYSRCIQDGVTSNAASLRPLTGPTTPPLGCDLYTTDFGGHQARMDDVSRPDASEYHPVSQRRWLAYVRVLGGPTDRGRPRIQLRVRDLLTGGDRQLPSGPFGTTRKPTAAEARSDARRVGGLGPVDLSIDDDVLAVRWHWMSGRTSRQAILRYDLVSGRMKRLTTLSQQPLARGSAASLSAYNQLGGPAVRNGRIWWTRWGARHELVSRTPANRLTREALPRGASGRIAADLVVTNGTYFAMLTPAGRGGECGANRPLCGIYGWW